MPNVRRWIAFIILISCCLSSCSSETYTPKQYSKNEVYSIFEENEQLFKELVFIISSNNTFFEEKRVSPFTDADIVSPYDDALDCFEKSEKDIIISFFRFYPYMITLDYGQRFVKVCFLASDNHISYTLLFWVESAKNTTKKKTEYINLLSQKYIVETISDNCIMYYR